jgi:iron complex transport system permease protein
MQPLTTSRLATQVALAALACLGCLAFAACLGTDGFSLSSLPELFARGDEAEILREARLTRVVLGALCGAALSMAGAALQALLRNPLADPFVVGVSGGAAVGGTAAVTAAGLLNLPVLQGLGAWLLPMGAYAGALTVLLLIYTAARVGGRTSSSGVLLSGVVFNAFCLALVSVLRLLVRAETAQSLMSWMMGSVGSETWTMVLITGVYVGVGLAWLMVLAGPLHLLAQGDEAAARLGVRVEAVRMQAYLATSLVVAGVVSETGMIGFVGLMVPHICRLFTGADVRVLLPVSALMGAGFLTLCDGMSRALFQLLGTEFPVGAITALLGGPAFLWLLSRQSRTR